MSSEGGPAGAHERVGQTLGGRFTVLGVIGQGGMGAVFDVRHEYTKQRGALKLLHQRYAAVDEVVARFINEASAAGRIDSRHIVRTFDAGRLPETNEPYIFMERLEGSSLARLLSVQGTLRVDEVVHFAGQVCDGLHAAHSVGIVHRDVKPDNLFVVSGADPVVKILDFGISKFAPERSAAGQLTLEGSTLGTPAYMPPEQIMGQRDLDHRADVYALGVVLYECATGKLPFTASVYHELCQQICDGQYVPVSELRRDAPLGFDALIARALAVDMNDRFASMLAFKAALDDLAMARPASLAPTHWERRVVDPVATDASAREGGTTRPSVAVVLPRGAARPAADTTKLWLSAGGVSALGVLGLLFWWFGADSGSVGTDGMGLEEQRAGLPASAASQPAGPLVEPRAEGPSVTRASRESARVRPGADAGAAASAVIPRPAARSPAPQLAASQRAATQPSSSASSERRSIRDGLSDENPFE